MKILKPFISILPDALQPVALDDGTLLFAHRDTIRNRTCIVTAEELHEYTLTESDDHAAAILPFETDITEWLKANFPCEKPTYSFTVFGKEAARKCDETKFETDGDKTVNALETIDNILKDNFGRLVIRKFNTEEERNAYYQGIEDGDGWEDSFNLDQLHDNPFTEEEIAKQIERQSF